MRCQLFKKFSNGVSFGLERFVRGMRFKDKCTLLKSLILFILFVSFDCKKYNRCELGRELLDKYHFPLNDISKWLCIAHWESAFETGVVNRGSRLNSFDYGIFQINDYKWCQSSYRRSQNRCNLHCERFRDDDLSDDVQCLKTIMMQSNFREWMSYDLRCRNDAERYLSDCDMTSRAVRVSLKLKPPPPKSILKLGLRLTKDPKGIQVNVVPPAVRFNLISKILESKLLGFLRIKPFFSMHQYVT